MTRPYIIEVAGKPVAIIDTISAPSASAAYAASLSITARAAGTGDWRLMRDLPVLEAAPKRVQRDDQAAAVERDPRVPDMFEAEQAGAEAGAEPGTPGAAAPAPAPAAETWRRPPRPGVPIRYRDPETGETWTGRGLMPKWLKVRIEAGRSLEEFAAEEKA